MKQRTAPPRRRFTKQERANWLVRYRASGLKQGEFAANHGLKVGTLVQWLAKERRGTLAGSASFVEVPFEPVGAPEGWVAELTWPSGLRVRLGTTAPKSWLGAVLKGAR